MKYLTLIIILLCLTIKVNAYKITDVYRLLNTGSCQFGDLSGVDLSFRNLDGVNLSMAYLEGANLSRTDFRDSNLRKVNFSNANLFQATLEGSNVEGAVFYNARNVNFKGTRGAGFWAIDYPETE